MNEKPQYLFTRRFDHATTRSAICDSTRFPVLSPFVAFPARLVCGCCHFTTKLRAGVDSTMPVKAYVHVEGMAGLPDATFVLKLAGVLAPDVIAPGVVLQVRSMCRRVYPIQSAGQRGMVCVG